MKKRGLGIGLDELLSDVKQISQINENESFAIKSSLKSLPVDLLRPGKYQPRREVDHDALEELANSIRMQGIIQPLVVRQITPGLYEIIAGERRWRAAQLASLQEVPVVIRDISDETAAAFSLIENIQRENLNAIDMAQGIERLINEFSMTHEGAANAIGKSRVTVTNLLRLLTLHEDVKTMLQRGEIEMGHARALLALEPSMQISVAKNIIEKGLSVRGAESIVRRIDSDKLKTELGVHSEDANITKLQQTISDKIGARVLIQHTTSGKGKLLIKYNSLDELDGILEKIGIKQL